MEQAITYNPLIVSPERLVTEVLALMSATRISCSLTENLNVNDLLIPLSISSSCVLVVDNNQLVGIFTEKAIVGLSAKKKSLTGVRVSEVMSSPVITLRVSQFIDVFTVLNLFQQHKIRHLPLLAEDGQIIGLITHEGLRQVLRPLDLLQLRLIDDVMIKSVIIAPPTAKLLTLVELMVKHEVSSVVIVEEQDQLSLDSLPLQIPVGIVTEKDVVQFQTLELDLTTISAEMVMSRPVFTLSPQDSLWSVRSLMQERRIRHIVVTGNQGELQGILTSSNLLQVLNPMENYILLESLEQKIDRLERENLQLLQRRNAELETEVQKRTQELNNRIEWERLLADVADRIRSSLELQEILDISVTEVRQVLDCDRVVVYQFLDDQIGEIVAESVNFGWTKTLGDQFIKPFLYESVYFQDRCIAVANIHEQNYSDCYLELLERYQVKSNLAVPILVENQMWGLLIGHQCANYRQWEEFNLEIMNRLAVQLAIAIQQAKAYARSRTELQERLKAEIALQKAQGSLKLLNQELETKFEQRTQELQQSEKRFRTLFTVAPDNIYLLDMHGVIQQVNQSVIEQSGYSKEELIGQYLKDFFANDHPQLSPQRFFSRLQQGSYRREVEFICKNGSKRIMECSVTIVYDDEEKPQYILVLQRDITERKQIENDLQQRNQQLAIANSRLETATKLKDEFLATMSHELRTPLNAILGMSEALQDNQFGLINPQQQRTIETIERSGQHLLDLINDILDLAKIESGKLELHLNSASIYYLCRESIALIYQQAIKKNINLEMRIPPGLGEINVDERYIRQVLINLLSNAIKFTSDGGTVRLEVKLELPMIEIAIIDTGIGIAPENIHKLFQSFVQVDNSWSRQYPGTGLGLAIVRKITELHGGNVGVESKVGEGSCFTIRLPYETTSTENPTPQTSEQIIDFQTITSNNLIILIENNEATISTLSDYLLSRGYTVLIARSSREVIDLTQTHKPDLILMDMQMLNMDGLETTKQIRADPTLANIPIIAMSAIATPEEQEKCLQLGINEYLIKPVRLRHLVDTIQAFLNK
ncbi:CBS domain-containing protein [Cronbergia sp. UHCC 0137]|uniref:CBS domain-containing protein n=1 Tax=Cronbergia sp. UHCC 0137 TaxID=3110239 RepID=UPI002B1F9D49|nr:CBS domain-containing protein [Cronbergia sp. UHCC 0137]MEA5619557.1 CBS domain-containing protein [Cronbergia sp. UHCC 0137]